MVDEPSEAGPELEQLGVAEVALEHAVLHVVAEAEHQPVHLPEALRVGSYFRQVVTVLSVAQRLLDRPDRFAHIDALAVEGGKLATVCETGAVPDVRVEPRHRLEVAASVAMVTGERPSE